MNLQAMHTFVRVAELASFTQAALQLGLPKASVSLAVQRLEADLGTRLLHRTTRRVQLTPDGQAFYERCRDLLHDVDELQQLFRPAEGGLRGRLRVDMPLGAASHLVIPRLPEFLRAHPELQLELSSTDRRVDLVREGFDCVLRVGPLADSSLVARPLGRYRQITVASPAYAMAHGLPLRLEDLPRHRLVHYAPVLGAPTPGFEWIDEQGQPRCIAMPGAVTVNNSEAYVAACLAGLGLIQAPETGLRPLVQQGRLIEVLPQVQGAALPVSLLYAHRRHLPQRVQAFMQWLAAVVQPHLLPP